MTLDFFKPLSNITPFTYRDGETYLEQNKRLRDWANEFTGVVTDQFEDLTETFDAGMALAIAKAAAAAASAAAAVGMSNAGGVPILGPGVDLTGATDSTVAVQAAIDAAHLAGFNSVSVPTGAILQLSDTINLPAGMNLSGPGEMRWVSGIESKPGIQVNGNGGTIQGLRLTNPNYLGIHTKGVPINSAISIYGSDVSVLDCFMNGFQNGIVVNAQGEFTNHRFIGNRIKDITGGGDGAMSPSDNGEDRGDGIVTWGAQATIIGNIINCKKNSDARIGIHVEGLPEYEVQPDRLGNALVTIADNLVYGQFRRSIVAENMSYVTITGNVVADATWWGIGIAQKSSFITVSNNVVLWTRTYDDNQGDAWGPTRAPICRYTNATNDIPQGLRITNNQIHCLPGSVADNAIMLQSVANAPLPDIVVESNNIVCDATAVIRNGIEATYPTVSDLVIRGNKVKGVTRAGIFLFGVKQPLIEGNHLVGGPTALVGVDINTNGIGPTIKNNVIKGFSEVSIGIANVTQIPPQILDNECDNGVGIFASENAIIRRNRLIHAGGKDTGIALSGACHAPTIEDNVIHGFNDMGIYLYQLNSMFIRGNQITMSGAAGSEGVHLESPRDFPVVTSNFIRNCDIGLFLPNLTDGIIADNYFDVAVHAIDNFNWQDCLIRGNRISETTPKMSNYGIDTTVVSEDNGRNQSFTVWNPGNIPDGTSVTKTVDLDGAIVGRPVQAWADNVSGCLVSAYVSAVDEVTIVVANLTGSGVDLPEMTWKVLVSQ